MLVIGETDPAAINKRFAYLAHGAMAFDIGANCGQSVRRFLPNFDRVVAVEPADESFDVLEAEYGADDRVVLVRKACSDAAGVIVLDVRDIIDTGQLTSGDVGGFSWGQVHETREVEATTVDRLASKYGPPDMVKVDTEGHELPVLQGATETLQAHPRLLVEIHSRPNGEACHDLLRDAGYNDLEIVAHSKARVGSWAAHNHYWLVSA